MIGNGANCSQIIGPFYCLFLIKFLYFEVLSEETLSLFVLGLALFMYWGARLQSSKTTEPK